MQGLFLIDEQLYLLEFSNIGAIHVYSKQLCPLTTKYMTNIILLFFSNSFTELQKLIILNIIT